MKSKSKIIGGNNLEFNETIKTINGELYFIYLLIKSIEIRNTSNKEIEEIRNDLHNIRKRLQLYSGGE